MTETSLNLRVRALRHASLRASAIGLISAGAAGVLCVWAAGASMGLYVGGMGFVTLLIPLLILGERRAQAQLALAIAAVLGMSGAWLTWGPASASFGEIFRAILLLGAWVAALAALSIAFRRLGLPRAIAGGGVILLALLWLSWPFWLSPHLTFAGRDRVVEWLVWGHPIFALDGIMRQFGPWMQQMLAYRHTRLGVDIVYTLPVSVLPAVLLHGLLAGAALAVVLAPGRRRPGMPQ